MTELDTPRLGSDPVLLTPAHGRWYGDPASPKEDPLRLSSQWKRLLALGGFLLLLSGLAPLVAIPLLSIAGIVAAYLEMKIGLFSRIGLPATERDLALLEDDAPGVQLVRVTVMQEGVVTGRDRGVAWIQEDVLRFTGHHCSFALGGQDVGGDPRKPSSPTEDRRVGVAYPNGRVELRFEPLSYDRKGRDSGGFFLDLHYFRQARRRSVAARQYPPLALGPNLTPLGFWWQAPLAGLLIAAAVGWLYLLTSGVISVLPLGFSLVMALRLSLGSLWASFRAFRLRQRLAQAGDHAD